MRRISHSGNSRPTSRDGVDGRTMAQPLSPSAAARSVVAHRRSECGRWSFKDQGYTLLVAGKSAHRSAAAGGRKLNSSTPEEEEPLDLVGLDHVQRAPARFNRNHQLNGQSLALSAKISLHHFPHRKVCAVLAYTADCTVNCSFCYRHRSRLHSNASRNSRPLHSLRQSGAEADGGAGRRGKNKSAT